MLRSGFALVCSLVCFLAGQALADAAAFQALSADAQQVVNRVTDNKPEDTAVCSQGADGLKSSLVDATKHLYFAGSLKGDPRAAGTDAGAYLKALCKH